MGLQLQPCCCGCVYCETGTCPGRLQVKFGTGLTDAFCTCSNANNATVVMVRGSGNSCEWTGGLYLTPAPCGFTMLADITLAFGTYSLGISFTGPGAFNSIHWSVSLGSGPINCRFSNLSVPYSSGAPNADCGGTPTALTVTAL